MKKLKTTNSPSVILKLKNIKPNSKITLFNIAHCIKLKWTLSQGLLAEMGGMSERTINRCLNELEENGYIKRDTKLFNGKGKETSYTIIWDSITKYAKEYEWYDDKNSNTADLSPSNNEEVEQPQPTIDSTTEAIKSAINDILPNEFMDGLENATEKSNITTEDIKEIMGNYIGEVEKLNNKTTGENSNFDFESIDRLIPKINKEMVLKQIKPYLSKEKNIGRLNDALSIFLKDVSLDDRTKYYEFLLEQSFAVA